MESGQKVSIPGKQLRQTMQSERTTITGEGGLLYNNDSSICQQHAWETKLNEQSVIDLTCW